MRTTGTADWSASSTSAAREAPFGQRARVYALCEASKIGARGVELGREGDQRGGRLALPIRGELRKADRYFAEISFGSGPQLLPEVAPLRIAGLYEPAPRVGHLADARRDVGLQANVGDRQPYGGGDRSRERLVAQRRRVVHERGDRRARVLHDRDFPGCAVFRRQRHRLACLVDPLVTDAIGDRERRIADGPGQSGP